MKDNPRKKQIKRRTTTCCRCTYNRSDDRSKIDKFLILCSQSYGNFNPPIFSGFPPKRTNNNRRGAKRRAPIEKRRRKKEKRERGVGVVLFHQRRNVALNAKLDSTSVFNLKQCSRYCYGFSPCRRINNLPLLIAPLVWPRVRVCLHIRDFAPRRDGHSCNSGIQPVSSTDFAIIEEIRGQLHLAATNRHFRGTLHAGQRGPSSGNERNGRKQTSPET